MPQSIAFVVLAALIVGAPPAWALANPASVFCLKSGGRLEMRERLRGQYNVCILPDGRVVEEWKFFRKNHGWLGGER